MVEQWSPKPMVKGSNPFSPESTKRALRESSLSPLLCRVLFLCRGSSSVEALRVKQLLHPSVNGFAFA